MWWWKGGSEVNHFDRPHHCCDFGPDLASKDSSPSVDWLDWKGFHVFQLCTILLAASMFSRLWTSSVSVFYCLQESSFVVSGLEEEGREFQVVRLSLRPFSSPEDENLNHRALFFLVILTLIQYILRSKFLLFYIYLYFSDRACIDVLGAWYVWPVQKRIGGRLRAIWRGRMLKYHYHQHISIFNL